MKYKAVIFDLDGTLLDTISDIADSFNAALAKLNYPTFDESEYRYFAGRGIDELVNNLIKAANLDNSIFDELKLGYINEYAIRSRNKTKVFDGMLDLINKLSTLGIYTAILSNKPHFQTEEVVSHYFKDYKFDMVYGKKPEFDIKPNPASAFDLIKKLNVSKEEVLYIGDTNTDMQTASNAGFKSVGVLWGFRDKDELIKSGANYIVGNPLEILSIIEGDDLEYIVENNS